MKIYHLAALAILAWSSQACWNTKPKIEDANIYKDTLSYQFKNIKTNADDCAGKPDSACTTVKFKYPAFDNQPVLNDTIVTGLATLLDRQKGIAGLQRLSWQFMLDYKDFKKSRPDWKGNFDLNCKVNVIRQDSSLVGLEYNGYQFIGGAHGDTKIRYLNWNVKQNKKILLSDILKPGSEAKLTTIGEKIFRKQENLDAATPLSRDYFFKDGKFTLNQNFLITPLGLKFLYNQSEIKPYAAGQTTLDIPYAQIKTLLQPNTVVVRYL
ncbi:DUF3298 domain-containing protein [Mucilaginibacter sp. CSA2-8R]|uniref:DUF3298 and DUF4163 domain-containing protein n=1 Tax=Mucilaginibacter sp. CSA2-8R TaxID=3141542 RepID=UPI00315D9599